MSEELNGPPGMRSIRAVYVGSVQVKHPEDPEEHTLHVWMNPETKKLVAIDHGDLECEKNYIPDPYEHRLLDTDDDRDVALIFHDTFTGLPK